jgi:hypothetical protein
VHTATSSRVVNNARSHHVDDFRVAARGQKRRYTTEYQQWVRTPWGSTGPLYVQTEPPNKVQNLHGCAQTPGTGPGPPLCRVYTTLSKVPGQNMHRPWTGPRRGSGDDTCPDPVWCGPVRLGHCSPHGWRPNAATWPTARDVSRRADLDVRPPGYAASTFIADKARRLSVLLTGEVPSQHLMSTVYSAGRDVPPQHLMCPIHSTGRRRPGHPAGGVPVYSGGR